LDIATFHLPRIERLAARKPNGGERRPKSRQQDQARIEGGAGMRSIYGRYARKKVTLRRKLAIDILGRLLPILSPVYPHRLSPHHFLRAQRANERDESYYFRADLTLSLNSRLMIGYGKKEENEKVKEKKKKKKRKKRD
jgi:hypothetical protein